MRDDELRTGSALDEACARAMGWVRVAYEYMGNEQYKWVGYPREWVARHGPRGEKTEVPRYSESPVLCRTLEDEIERRQLRWAYIRTLIQMVAPHAEQAVPDLWYVNHLDIFLLLRATPEQRARAFLKAVSDA